MTANVSKSERSDARVKSRPFMLPVYCQQCWQAVESVPPVRRHFPVQRRKVPCMSQSIETPDWSTIPAPEDDGATALLVGQTLPAIALAATDGTFVDLSKCTGRV